MNREREPNPQQADVIGANRIRHFNGWLRAYDFRVPSREESSGRWVVPFSRLRSLVVPLDGTSFAEHALPHAIAIARRSGAKVRLVQVHSLRDSVSFWEQYYSDSLINRLRRKKQEYVQSIAGRVRRLVDTEVAGIVVESGEITESLSEAAAGASAVVMATHGRGLVGRLLHGSLADSLIRRLSCPVLLVGGSRFPVDLTRDPMPRHVLIPLDGTRFSENVFDAAVDIGSLSSARFTLAHLQHVGEAEFWPDRSGARGHLQGAAMRLKQRVPNVNTEFIISNQRTAPAIVSLIKEKGIDMVALTTHGRHGLARLVKGSVAASVARTAKVPVLVFRPLDQPAESHGRSLARSLWRWMQTIATE